MSVTVVSVSTWSCFSLTVRRRRCVCRGQIPQAPRDQYIKSYMSKELGTLQLNLLTQQAAFLESGCVV
jgi:hypothetical protein